MSLQTKFWIPDGNSQHGYNPCCMYYCDSAVVCSITMSHGAPKEQILGEGSEWRLYEIDV